MYEHGFKQALANKFGRSELLPRENPIPACYELGERFLRNVGSSLEDENENPEHAVYAERLKTAAFADTQFANESLSYELFHHCLSLPERDQAEYFKTAITLDAMAALMKMQSYSAAGVIASLEKTSRSSESANRCTTSSSTSCLGASSVDKGVTAASNPRGIRLFEGSDEKKELSEKGADLVFQNPVLFFVKNAASSVTDALCSSKAFLPDHTYTEKVFSVQKLFLNEINN